MLKGRFLRFVQMMAILVATLIGVYFFTSPASSANAGFSTFMGFMMLSIFWFPAYLVFSIGASFFLPVEVVNDASIKKYAIATVCLCGAVILAFFLHRAVLQDFGFTAIAKVTGVTRFCKHSANPYYCVSDVAVSKSKPEICHDLPKLTPDGALNYCYQRYLQQAKTKEDCKWTSYFPPDYVYDDILVEFKKWCGSL